jgi:hypothetical protein
MAKCRECEAKILWVEIETKNGMKAIPVDPKPAKEGDLTLRPTHPDAPMIASKATAQDRREAKPLYVSHRQTCPKRDPNEQYQDRQPSWVREPEGY